MKLLRSTIATLAMTATALAGAAQQVAAQGQPAGEPVMLGPTSRNAGGKDFIDAKGRRWIATGKVQFKRMNAPDTAMRRTGVPKPSSQVLTVKQLAEALRPRRLVGDVEYRLAEPDHELARKIMMSGKAPATRPHIPAGAMRPRFVIGSDTRTRVAAPRYWPGSPFGYLGQTCTLTMIGPSTALSAAHCFYQNGWIATPSLTLAADTRLPTAPFGSFLFDTITLPGQWNLNELDWDFAVLEFSPTRRPGYMTGWYGTEQSSTGMQTMIGYPKYNPHNAIPSQWIKSGTYTAFPGSRYEHNLDITHGDSGACTYNASDRCTGIQSSEFNINNRIWNEVRRWDRTTYQFFDAYGNWP